MKHILIGILLLLAAMSVHAQTVTYAYDAAGNRTARVVTLAQNLATPQVAAKSPTALSDVVAEKKIIIYPNPTKGIVKVEITGYTDDTKASFRLMNMSGQTINARTADSSSQSFDLSNQAAGIYLLQITINGESVVWKIIKE